MYGTTARPTVLGCCFLHGQKSVLFNATCPTHMVSRKSSLVHSADLCRVRVRAVIDTDRYAM